MSAIAAIFREIWGLFVDDGSLAAGCLALTAALAAARYTDLISPPLAGLALLLGLLALLAENLRRSARRLKR